MSLGVEFQKSVSSALNSKFLWHMGPTPFGGFCVSIWLRVGTLCMLWCKQNSFGFAASWLFCDMASPSFPPNYSLAVSPMLSSQGLVLPWRPWRLGKRRRLLCLTRASYVLRFSVSCFRYTDGRFSEALDAARGLNTRTSKKVRSNLPPQTPLADMSNLAPSCTLVPAGSSWSTCWSCGSVATSWHVSVITLASRSRISLCRIMGKPPVGHDSACSTSNGLLHTHFVGMWSGCRP